MYNPILAHRQEVSERIIKGFETDEIEKAHQDGDHHPTKPWVWVASANNGRGDWRVDSSESKKKNAVNANTQTKHPNPKDVDSYIAKESGMSKAEIQEIKIIVKKWSGLYSSLIRAYQLGRSKDSSSKFMAEKLENFILRMPKWNGGTTYRGVRFQREVFESYEVGDIWKPMALSSWTSKKDVALKYSNPKNQTIIICNYPQNGTSIRYLSNDKHKDDDEILTSCKCEYIITGKKKVKVDNNANNDILIVEVKPINN